MNLLTEIFTNLVSRVVTYGQSTYSINVCIGVAGGTSTGAGPTVEIRLQRFSRVGVGTSATSGER